MAIIQDKPTIMFIIGSLMQDPSLVGDARGYKLEIDDFPEKFYRSIYGAIYNLYKDGAGAEKIGIPEIDAYLKNYPVEYAYFNNNNIKGTEVLAKCIEIAHLENFDMYYNTLKKYSALRFAERSGLDITPIYDTRITDPDQIVEMQAKFDQASLEQVVGFFETKVVDMKSKFLSDTSENIFSIGHNIRNTINGLKQAPDYGFAMTSGYLNEIFRGARKGKYYLVSAESGAGKTRTMIATMMNIATDVKYDLSKSTWIANGACHPVSIITTELDIEEIQTMAIAWLAAVPEWKIMTNKISKEESTRLDEAMTIFERLDEENLITIEYLPDYDVSDVKITIERHVLKYGIVAMAWDYLHTNAKLLGNLKNARNDQALLLVSNEFKNQAKKHNIFMLSGTQVTLSNETEKGVMSLRDSKSIADKADGCMLMFKVTAEELAKTKGDEYFGDKRPTHTILIYKNRGNLLNAVKVYITYDLSLLEMKDRYVTTKDDEIMPQVKGINLNETAAGAMKQPIKIQDIFGV